MRAHVVIIGAGYAGAMAAKRLLRTRSDVTVTVVNPRPHFVQRIRLHQMIAAGYDTTVSFDRALPRAAHRVFGEVTTIEARLGRLTLDDGSVLDYDYLVYAVGSGQSPTTGAAEHRFIVSEFEDAVRLKSRLAALDEKAAVCVVGGGLTGIETAAELAEHRSSRITLVTGGIVAPDLSERARSAILRTLTDLGVDIVTESRVTRIDDAFCELAGGVRVEADCTILATEFGVPELARRSGLPVDDLGRLKLDDRLECPSHPNIVGAGDAVAVGDLSLRMSCQAAIPLGVHAAETILHRLEGSAPRPVAPKFAGRCISLGRRRGVFQRTNGVDDATGMFVAGRAGAFVKERVCSSTTDWALSPRRSFFYSWT
ncbi:NAD(P)/FAD-dependent oxidoreductase [Rhodococcus sp. NPDC056506]|uniref:NAD(P)/FAD-dependent oxidoreductase n=1 Tax=Rhodococcus sp. NPDC056506 TaxID=3345844 RepID=UPI003672BBC1